MNTAKNVKGMSLTDIYKLIDAKKFDQAMPSVLDIKRLADEGDAVAQYYLGLLLISNKEDAEGGRYLKMSVEQNSLLAIKACLRDKLTSGFKDVREANSILLRKLMELGDDNARCAYVWSKLTDTLETFGNISNQVKVKGDIYDNAKQRERDFCKICRKVFVVLYRAATKGNTLSLFMLSEIYRNGLYIDIVFKYVLHSYSIGSGPYDYNLTVDEYLIHSNKDHARELLVRGANAGDVLCLLELMHRYRYSDAENLRLLEIARDKYNDEEWQEMKWLFNLRRFRRLGRSIIQSDAIIKKGVVIASCTGGFPGSSEEWDYVIGDTTTLPSQYKGLKPSALMQSGVTGVVDNTPLPDFLKADYERFSSELKKEEAAQKQKKLEATPEYQEAVRKKRREADARESAAKAAKERKDAMQGCGCLLAIVAIVGFVGWWWWEGFSMSALSGMWAQTKNSLNCSNSALKTCAMIGGGLVALLVLFGLIKGGKSSGQPSDKKRWKFVVLGLFFGFLGIHLAYAKRWGLFILLWAGLIFGGMMSNDKTADPSSTVDSSTEVVAVQDESIKTNPMKKHNMYENIGMGVWALLWLGGTLFIKKDGNGNRM